MPKRTPFYDFHVSSGAKLVDFAGWEMPILYRSIIDEHEQTRNSGSIFDVSHMGRLSFSGKGAMALLNKVLTRDVSKMQVGQCRYALICNEQGGILDDIIIGRDQKNWILVCNASNREKVLKHFQAVRRADDIDADMVDQTESTAMVAIQGPKVLDRLSGVLPGDLKAIPRFGFVSSSFMLIKFTIFRTGYTGEDGLELVLPAKMAPMAIKFLGGKGGNEASTIRPAGLGARDTLRLEAAMPLYGHELSEQIDPISADLAWAVNLEKEFIGAEALRRIAKEGPKRKRVGLELDGRRIARQGATILHNGQAVGEITSGTFSPTLQKSIAMGYVETALAAEGAELMIDLKGELNPAKIVKLPFYKRK